MNGAGGLAALAAVMLAVTAAGGQESNIQSPKIQSPKIQSPKIQSPKTQSPEGQPPEARSPDAGPARARSGPFPDWSGQWRRPDGVAAAWDPTKPPGLGQEAPLTPEYQAIFEATLRDRAGGGLTGDPTGLCLPHGMPRMMVAIFPVEFVITPNVTYYHTDYTTSRRIFTDGRAWPKELQRSFNGYSIGTWVDTDGDGRFDELRVETRGFKSPRTFEGSGLPLHADGESVITERIFQDRADADLLHDEITVVDHALTRPWTVTRHYRREAGGEWDFVDCAENNPHVVIGQETYMMSADGLLMPTKAGQRPPDLRYFGGGAAGAR